MLPESSEPNALPGRVHSMDRMNGKTKQEISSESYLLSSINPPPLQAIFHTPQSTVS